MPGVVAEGVHADAEQWVALDQLQTLGPKVQPIRTALHGDVPAPGPVDRERAGEQGGRHEERRYRPDLSPCRDDNDGQQSQDSSAGVGEVHAGQQNAHGNTDHEDIGEQALPAPEKDAGDQADHHLGQVVRIVHKPQTSQPAQCAISVEKLARNDIVVQIEEAVHHEVGAAQQQGRDDPLEVPLGLAVERDQVEGENRL